MNIPMFDKIAFLASLSPTGVPDPLAKEKLSSEIAEMESAISEEDYIGALLECADIIYYIVKILLTNASLISEVFVNEILDRVEAVSKLPLHVISGVCIAKYHSRLINKKNDNLERKATLQIVESYLARDSFVPDTKIIYESANVLGRLVYKETVKENIKYPHEVRYLMFLHTLECPPRRAFEDMDVEDLYDGVWVSTESFFRLERLIREWLL